MGWSESETDTSNGVGKLECPIIDVNIITCIAFSIRPYIFWCPPMHQRCPTINLFLRYKGLSGSNSLQQSPLPSFAITKQIIIALTV